LFRDKYQQTHCVIITPVIQDYQVRQNRRFVTKTFIEVSRSQVTDHVIFWSEEHKHLAAGLAPSSDTLQNSSVGRIRWRNFFFYFCSGYSHWLHLLWLRKFRYMRTIEVYLNGY